MAFHVLRIVLAFGLVLAPAASARAVAQGTLNVVATTEDLGALAREVGGDKVSVTALAKGYQDPHFVDPKPSFLLAVSRADMLIVVGRELEIGWLPPLVGSARNNKVQPGGKGYLDASLTVRILDVPAGQVTRAMGDVHPLGNPHYWLEPGNGRQIALAVRDKLTELSPSNAAYFATRYADFDARLAAAERRWDAAMAPFKGAKLVTYHRSWPNFMERFGLDVIGYVEPKPGIPPSPSHTLALIQNMKAQGVTIVVVEPYFDLRTPRSIASQAGGQVLVLAPSVGGAKEATGYIQLFDYDVNLLVDVLKHVAGR